jgi:RNA polymerase sigma-70 factor (ECF subfamily)
MSASMPAQRAELIRRMAGGDRDAFAAFYDVYAPLAFGVIRRIVRSAAEAEEVLQDVFWEIWSSAAEYDPARGSPEAWVVMRARSRGIDRARSMRRRSEMHDASHAASPPPEPAANPAVQSEARDAVRDLLDRLPANQRDVIELAFFQGLTQTEIAARVRQPLGTVKTRMRLGLQKLREILGGRV